MDNTVSTPYFIGRPAERDAAGTFSRPLSLGGGNNSGKFARRQSREAGADDARRRALSKVEH